MGTILATIYIPVADLRMGFADRSSMIGLPRWPAPTQGFENFQRNFGKITTRPLGGIRGWVGENQICQVSNSIAIYPTDEHAWKQARAQIAFKRFFYDGDGAGYFSIGVRRSPDLLRLNEIFIASRHWPDKVPLRSAGKVIAGLYARGSERGNQTSTRAVFGGTPIVTMSPSLAETISSSDFLQSESKMSAFACDDQPIRVVRPSAGRMPLYVMRDSDERQEARFLRVALARLYVELHFLERAVELISSSTLRSRIDDDGKLWLGTRLNECISRLTGRNSPQFVGMAGRYEEIVEQFSTLHRPGRIDDLLNGLKQIGARPGLARGVIEIVHRAFAVDPIPTYKSYAQNFGGAHVTTYNINGGNFGAVGDNASARNFSQQSASVTGADSAQLANELSGLLEEMRGQAKSTNEFRELAAVSAAYDKAKSGNVQAALDALKTTGQWSLGVAEKLGVGLAVAAIKAHLGF